MGVASGLHMAWNHGVNIPELYMYSRNCNDADRPFPQNLNAAHSDYSSHPQNHHLLSSTPSLWQRFGDSGHSPTAANRKCSISLCLEPLPPSLLLFVRHTLDLQNCFSRREIRSEETRQNSARAVLPNINSWEVILPTVGPVFANVENA